MRNIDLVLRHFRNQKCSSDSTELSCSSATFSALPQQSILGTYLRIWQLDFPILLHSVIMPDVDLPILHFNDVYRVSKQKLSKTMTIDVTQFAAMIDDIRDSWPQRVDGKRDGLVLFSGDLFSPSVESSVTRGSHLVSRQWLCAIKEIHDQLYVRFLL